MIPEIRSNAQRLWAWVLNFETSTERFTKESGDVRELARVARLLHHGCELFSKLVILEHCSVTKLKLYLLIFLVLSR